MNTKKLLKWALYYTAAATVYNIAVDSIAAVGSPPPLPLLPNPVAGLLLNHVIGTAAAPPLLAKASGGYGTWG